MHSVPEYAWWRYTASLYPARCALRRPILWHRLSTELHERYELFLVLLALPASGACRFGKKFECPARLQHSDLFTDSGL